MFIVYDCGQRTQYPDCHVPPSSWKTPCFSTFDEAVAYARQWLGCYDNIPNDWNGKPYVYFGCESFESAIEIREEPLDLLTMNETITTREPKGYE
jgi:hypothetical protein